MDLRKLGLFLAVVDEGGFTRAALAEFVSQPSVSQAIRELEAELGTPLFHRVGRGVTLTAAGEALVGPARQTLRDVEMARAAVVRGRRARGGTARPVRAPDAGRRPGRAPHRRVPHRVPGRLGHARRRRGPGGGRVPGDERRRRDRDHRGARRQRHTAVGRARATGDARGPPSRHAAAARARSPPRSSPAVRSSRRRVAHRRVSCSTRRSRRLGSRPTSRWSPSSAKPCSRSCSPVRARRCCRSRSRRTRRRSARSSCRCDRA